MGDDERECPMCGESCYQEGKDYPWVCSSNDCSWVDNDPGDPSVENVDMEPAAVWSSPTTMEPLGLPEGWTIIPDGCGFEGACELDVPGAGFHESEAEALAAGHALVESIAGWARSSREAITAERDALLVEVQALRAADGGAPRGPVAPGDPEGFARAKAAGATDEHPSIVAARYVYEGDQHAYEVLDYVHRHMMQASREAHVELLGELRRRVEAGRAFAAMEDERLAKLQLAAAAGSAPQGGPALSLSWARDLLRRCAVAENRIREEFAPEEGRQPEDAGTWPADECQRWLEGWAIGNLSARRAALQAHRDIEAARTVPVSVFADEPAEVRVINGAVLLKSGRVRLALSNAHAAATCEAMRALLPADPGAPHEHTERADVVAYIRHLAEKDEDPYFSDSAEALATVIDEGAHLGYAAKIERLRADALAPDPNQIAIFGEEP